MANLNELGRKIVVLHQTGEVSRVLTAFTVPFGEDYLKLFCDRLRHDWEKSVYGAGLPIDNPSEDPSTVKFFYRPCMDRQFKYRKLPYKEGTYDVVDAFACLGSRFYMHGVQVFVEVCKSNMGGRRIWANIYYVADSEIPAARITAEEIEFAEDYPGDGKKK